MDCQQFLHDLQQHLDRRTRPDRDPRLCSHARQCPTCAQRLRLQALFAPDWLRDARQVTRPPRWPSWSVAAAAIGVCLLAASWNSRPSTVAQVPADAQPRWPAAAVGDPHLGSLSSRQVDRDRSDSVTAAMVSVPRHVVQQARAATRPLWHAADRSLTDPLAVLASHRTSPGAANEPVLLLSQPAARIDLVTSVGSMPTVAWQEVLTAIEAGSQPRPEWLDSVADRLATWHRTMGRAWRVLCGSLPMEK